MVMRIVGRARLQHFCTKHPPTRSWVQSWLAECAGATWKTPSDIKAKYSTASFLGANVVIFNVKGNDYRMVTQVAYQTGVVVVRWIGTHQAYSIVNWDQSRNETSSR
jgi:mRNA interferase HigB